jgi:hypothetical protein
MRRFLLILAGLFSLIAPAAQAANSTVGAMTAGAAFSDTDLLYCAQTAGTVDRKCTPLQMAAYVFGKFSGDATANGTGTITLKNTGPGATGPIGNATSTPIITIDAQGRVTALTGTPITPSISNVTGMATNVPAWLLSATSANLAAALTDETGTGVAVFGTAPTISSPTINTAATFGFITGSTQCLHVNTSGVLSGTGSDCGSGSGAVSSVTGGIGVTVSPTTGAVVVSSPITVRNNTATTDTITSSDKGTVITESNAASVAVTITTAGFVSTDYFSIKNLGAGLATYTPSSGTIDGAATIACKQNQSADLYFDGTNYKTLASNCGGTITVASGTAALGTSAIASAACATVVTATATGTATTDVVTASFNGDPTAVTGYIPATAGMLTIITYPTANTLTRKSATTRQPRLPPERSR